MSMPASAVAQRYRFADAVISSSDPLPELLPAESEDHPDAPEITIAWTPQHEPSTVDWYHQWDDGRAGAIWARFGVVNGGYLVEFPDVARFHISGDAAHVGVTPVPDTPAVSVRHLLLNQVLPLVLSRRRPMVLHAGAVSINEEVVAFVGPTGAGKSTLVAACAALGAAVVADDSVVLHRAGQVWSAVPSYPALRLWAPSFGEVGWEDTWAEPAAHYTDKRKVLPQTAGWRFASAPVPLRRMVLLGGDRRPSRPAAVALFAQVFRLDVRDREDAVRLFHAVADLASAVSIERVEAPRAERRALDVAQRLLAGARCSPAPNRA